MGNFSLNLIFIIFLLCPEGKSGRRPKEPYELLIPCSFQDAVFLQGICVRCSKPSAYPNEDGKCNSFHRTKIIYNKAGRRVIKLDLITVNESRECEGGFGCINGNTGGIEVWKIKSGSAYLQGRTVRVVSVERHPFVKISKSGFYSGVLFEFMNAIKDKYKFSMTIFSPYDGNWGAQMTNGTWNGMVGQVLREEADVGVAGFSVTLERSRVIAFSTSYHQEPSAMLIPPPTEGEKLSVLIRPLSTQVWITLFITIIILAPTLMTMHVISLRISGDKRGVKSIFHLMGDLLHFMIGSLVQESVISPVNKTTRFLIILWWFLTLIIANIYVAYLVSYLSAPKLFNLFDDLEGLVKQNKIKWTFRQNTAHESLFKSNTSSGIYKLVGSGISREDLVSSDIQGVNKVLSGKYAFIKEKSYLDVAIGEDFLSTKGQCRMTVAKQTFFKVETALILQKQSKFLNLVNTEILRSVDTGLMEKWKSIHWPSELWCNDAVNYIPTTLPPTRRLQLEDLQGAGLILTIGLLLSTVAFVGERIYYFMTNTRVFRTSVADG